MATLRMGRLKLTTLKDVELIHGEKYFEPCCLQPIRARNSCTYPCKSKDHHGHEMGGKYNQKAHSRVLRVVAKTVEPGFFASISWQRERDLSSRIPKFLHIHLRQRMKI